MHDYILFMGNTGLRPDEAGNLEHRDVTIATDHATGQTILEIEVRGKRGVGCWSTPLEAIHHWCSFKWRWTMPRRIYKPEEIIAKLRQVEVLTSQGKSAVDAIRSIGVTDATYYRWRQEYGGLKVDQVKRLKELEAENTRLRRAVSDLTLEKLVLKEAASGNF